MSNLLPNPYLLVLGISIIAYIGIWGLRRILSTKFESNNYFKNKWDVIIAHTVSHTTQVFMICSALYIGLQYISLRESYELYADRIFFVVLMVQAAIWFNYLVDQWIISTIDRRSKANRAAAGGLSFLKLASKIVLFSAVFLFTLNNLNIKVTTILAGLGVGGIAIALALQKILGDLFASLSILLDKPFVVGDFIIVDNLMGDVEKIGLRSTHVRSLSGEQLIFPNSDLVGARIKNYMRMKERRVSFILSLSLDTTPDKLEKAVTMATIIVKSKDRVRFDRLHFFQVAKTSMDIEIVYFVLSDDVNVHMDIQQVILLEIYRAFQDNDIHFAYPVQAFHQGAPVLWKSNENSFPIPQQRS